MEPGDLSRLPPPMRGEPSLDEREDEVLAKLRALDFSRRMHALRVMEAAVAFDVEP